MATPTRRAVQLSWQCVPLSHLEWPINRDVQCLINYYNNALHVTVDWRRVGLAVYYNTIVLAFSLNIILKYLQILFDFAYDGV